MINSSLNITEDELDKIIVDNGVTQIYSVKGDSDKIVKVTWGESDIWIGDLFTKFDKFKNDDFAPLVKLFKYTASGFGYRYCVMMERLETVSHTEYNELSNYFYDYARGMLDIPSFAKQFIEHYHKSPYSYQDWHAGNVMKNKNGEYKLIDLESLFYLQPGDTKCLP